MTKLSAEPENAEYFIGRLAMYNCDPETVHAVMRIIDSLRAELAEANRCREFGYQECVKHLEELDRVKAERARLRAIEAAARKFLLAAEDWDACISPQDDEGHSLRKYIEAREALREAIKP